VYALALKKHLQASTRLHDISSQVTLFFKVKIRQSRFCSRLYRATTKYAVLVVSEMRILKEEVGRDWMHSR
jgi:hypothetical protein